MERLLLYCGIVQVKTQETDQIWHILTLHTLALYGVKRGPPGESLEPRQPFPRHQALHGFLRSGQPEFKEQFQKQTKVMFTIYQQKLSTLWSWLLKSPID